MLTIGEFSQASRIPIKTLRYYHELGILDPAKIDDNTGYRFYNGSNYEQALKIITLKNMGFTLKEIQDISHSEISSKDLIHHIEKKLRTLHSRIGELHFQKKQLAGFLKKLQESPDKRKNDIQEVMLNIPHIAAVPVYGTYDQIGSGFSILYKKLNRLITGKPYAFLYDMEYTEKNAKMEAAVEIKTEVNIPGIKCGVLSDLKVLKIIYKGPYGFQGSAYLKVFEYCKKNNYKLVPPIIEHYIKGPGMIFKRNPDSYITECIFPIQDNEKNHLFLKQN